MSTAFDDAISARDCRDFHLVTARMNAEDCEHALLFLQEKFPRRRSQIMAIKARLNWLNAQPNMQKVK